MGEATLSTEEAPPPVLVVEHVPWEGPHRIANALADLPVLRAEPLRGGTLPRPEGVSGAVLMGGPMSVNDTDRFPALADEARWLADALALGVPILGVCLGAQLLARALGAGVRPAATKELGWGPVEVLAADDPVLGPLSPRAPVLHWHGEVFDMPPGATALARSKATEVQAFRAGESAWGVLFHAEADARLVERWLAEPSMAAEAEEALGPGHAQLLRDGARASQGHLLARSARGFEAFAARCRERTGR